VHIDGTGATTTTAISQANTIMAFMDGLGEPGNYLLLGDMNSDASTDAAMDIFYNHTNVDCRFYDPINKPGTWHNASSFAAYHTQSTAVTRSDCGASGGLDDRFDHIMISRFVKDDSARVSYVPGSYWAFGQDGLHYNDDIDGTPTNTTVSSTVATALHYMSDHLPVTLDLAIAGLPASQDLAANSRPVFTISPNPVQGMLQVRILRGEGTSSLEVMDLAGKVQRQMEVLPGESAIGIDLTSMAPGIYLIRLSGTDGSYQVQRMVKL
jgi:hypothetical protein